MGDPGRHAARAAGNDRRWLIVGLVALGIAALMGGYLVAVAGNDEGAMAPTPTGPIPSNDADPSLGEPTQASTSTPPPATEAPLLEDGLHFVQPISLTQSEPYQLTFDLGAFYTGAEAFEYAEENGIELVNDYVIVNENPKLRTMAFVQDAAVLYIPIGTCCELVDGNLEALAESVNGTNPTDYPDPETAWWFITVESGQIHDIVQQYLP